MTDLPQTGLPAGARSAAAALRNRGPILEALRPFLPETGEVLEIAGGTGEHAVFFAQALPGLSWRPTDCNADALSSMAAWRDAAGTPNLLEPLRLDGTDPDHWPVTRADVILSINMIHIAPWAAAVGLFAGASRILPPGGILALYGPFAEGGRHIAPSNAAFDANLKARNPEWGVRDLEAVGALATGHGFERVARIEMPANNLTVVFRKP